MPRLKYPKDLTGLSFGSWLVLEEAPQYRRKNDKGTVWRCRCVCGTERALLRSALTKHTSKSCGKGSCHRWWKGGQKERRKHPPKENPVFEAPEILIDGIKAEDFLKRYGLDDKLVGRRLLKGWPLAMALGRPRVKAAPKKPVAEQPVEKIGGRKVPDLGPLLTPWPAVP